MLHHGTIDMYVGPILNAIDVACGRHSTDFSNGFYTTTNYDQARAHARNMLHRLQQRGARRGAVLTYTVDRDAIAALRSLAFARATDDFWDLVDWCRGGQPCHTGGRYYDVVCGPVARKPRHRTVYASYDQVSFHTAHSITLLGTPVTSFIS